MNLMHSKWVGINGEKNVPADCVPLDNRASEVTAERSVIDQVDSTHQLTFTCDDSIVRDNGSGCLENDCGR